MVFSYSLGKKYEKVFKKAKKHSLSHLRRTHDFHRAIELSFIIALILNLVNMLKDLVSGNPSWKIGLFFEFVLAFILVIFIGKSINSASALEVREKKKHNSKKEAFKIIREYHALE